MTRSDGTELRALRVELLDAHRELVRLRSQIEQVLASNRDLSALLSSTARRTGELVKIIVAFRRLLDAADASTAVRTIEDILINVIGTEDFVVMLDIDGPRSALLPVAGMGPTHEHARQTPATMDEVARRDARLVRLHIAEHVVGVIVIGALLAHRDPFNGSDDQVLSLLSRFGAPAVMAAHHRKDWTGIPAAALA
jgi:hypothetical protein